MCCCCCVSRDFFVKQDRRVRNSPYVVDLLSFFQATRASRTLRHVVAAGLSLCFIRQARPTCLELSVCCSNVLSFFKQNRRISNSAMLALCRFLFWETTRHLAISGRMYARTRPRRLPAHQNIRAFTVCLETILSLVSNPNSTYPGCCLDAATAIVPAR